MATWSAPHDRARRHRRDLRPPDRRRPAGVGRAPDPQPTEEHAMNYANDTPLKAAGIEQCDAPSPVAVAISDLVDTQSSTASLLEKLQRALTPVLSETK